MDARAARQCVVQRFQHQHAAAFTDDQAIAVAVVGAGREFRRVVLLAGGVERVEHQRLAGAELFRPTGQHHFLAAVADGFIGVADALAARRAGAGRGDDAALQFEEDADVGGRGVRHHAHIGIGVEIVGDAIKKHVAEGADFSGAAHRRAAGHAHAAVGDAGIAQQRGIFQRQFGGAHGQLRHAAHAAQLLAGPVRGHAEIFHRPGQPRVQFGKARPVRHVPDGAAARLKCLLHAGPIRAQRADAGHAGNDDAVHQHKPPLTAMTWRVM
ncbi:hypothetical protein D3C71_1115240 [compost metagenome]